MLRLVHEEPEAETRRLLRSLSAHHLAGILAVIAGRLYRLRLLTLGEHRRVGDLIDRAIFGDMDRAA